MNDPVQASLASLPEREEMLRLVLLSLAPQVDVLRVFLNGYEQVPAFIGGGELRDVVVACSQDHGDLGAAGKMFWSATGEGYQFTCDDDLIYPQYYVSKMIDGIERYGRKAVVSLHGSVIRNPALPSYYDNRKILHCTKLLETPRSVHVLGSGCMAYHSSTVHVRCEDFLSCKNAIDLQMAVFCQQQGVTRVVLEHAEAKTRMNGETLVGYDPESNVLVHLNPRRTISRGLREPGTNEFCSALVASAGGWQPLPKIKSWPERGLAEGNAT